MPEPIPSGVAAPNVLPSPKKAVTVIPVMASTQPSPKKAALAIKDCAEAKPAIASKNALESNAKLEQALEARATGKKEEKDAEQKEQTQPKEASPQPKVGQMKKPAAAGKAASKKRPAAGAVSSGPVMKRPATSKQVASSGTKGPAPPMSTRLRLRPDGCSKCRHVKGCTNSCWWQRGYDRTA